MTDSSTGGYLTISATVDGIETAIQSAIAGITGISPSLVRIAYDIHTHDDMAYPQTVMELVPNQETDWVAFWVEQTTQSLPVITTEAQKTMDGYLATIHVYGPKSRETTNRLIVGISIPQNQEALQNLGISYQGVETTPHSMPELINQRWYRRFFFTLRFAEYTARDYRIYPLIDSDIRIITETQSLFATIAEYMTDEGATFPVCAPSTTYTAPGYVLQIAQWNGTDYYNETEYGYGYGWRKSPSVIPYIEAEEADDGAWIPTMCAGTISIVGDITTITAEWNGATYQKTYTLTEPYEQTQFMRIT